MRYELMLDMVNQVSQGSYGNFYLYRSSDAFEGEVKIRDGDINGVYIKRELLEDPPPQRIQITLEWGL